MVTKELPKVWRLVHDPDNGFPKDACFRSVDINLGKDGWLPGTIFEHVHDGRRLEIVKQPRGDTASVNMLRRVG